MYSSEALAQFDYRLHQCQCHPSDAAADAAQFYGLDYVTFAQFLRTIGHRYGSAA
jgi:hypothetical protein